MITYDTTISIFNAPFGPTNIWNIRITRPRNYFTAGHPDTASRPAIITMPGQGELGTTDTSKLTVYGPHFWLKNGWDGGIQLGNGRHYPLLITVCYTNSVNTYAADVLNIVDTLIKFYHIKARGRHFAGLSEGAFTWGALVCFEKSAGTEDGMSRMTSLVALEGTPNPAINSWDRRQGAYKVWAAKYGGKYFYLEGNGSDNFRNGYLWSQPMNDTVPGSAYFAWETLGGGSHCCWNSMYDPSVTNWSTIPVIGPNIGTGPAPNTQGTYRTGQNIFTWMLAQGDTTLVGPTCNPIVTPGSNQTITLPTSSSSISASVTYQCGNTASNIVWSQVSGPNNASITSPNLLTTGVAGLIQGTYVFKITVTDNTSLTGTATVQVTVNSSTRSPMNFTWPSTNSNILINNTTFGVSLMGGDTVFIPVRSGGYRSFTIDRIGTRSEGKYITIVWQNGSFITPNTSSPLGANSIDSSFWVHIYNWTMNDNIDVAFTSYANLGYSQHIWIDHCTFRGMNGFFPSSPRSFATLPNFTGDTINCFYKWRWSYCTFDSLVGANSGNTAIYIGALAKNQTWINVEIDHDKFGDYSALSNPPTYIFAYNVYGIYIHHDSLWNFGMNVPNPRGHAAMLFLRMSYFEVYNCWFGTNNFGNCVRNWGAADIPSMFNLFSLWSTGYNGRSRVYNCISDSSRKYPFLECQSHPGDTSSLSPYIRARTVPEVWFITLRHQGLGIGNDPYVPGFDFYDHDSLFVKNCYLVGPTDTVWTACNFGTLNQGCNKFINNPGSTIVWDTAATRFVPSIPLIGLQDSTFFIPTTTGMLYKQGIPGPTYTSLDYYGNTRDAVHPNIGFAETIDIIKNYLIIPRSYRINIISN